MTLIKIRNELKNKIKVIASVEGKTIQKKLDEMIDSYSNQTNFTIPNYVPIEKKKRLKFDIRI